MSEEESKELAITESNPLSLVNDQVEAPAKIEMPVPTGNWVPSLGICYALSKSFTDGIAQPGEFVLAGQTSLGKEISVVTLDYRVHAMMVRNNSEVDGNAYHSSKDQRNLEADEEFQKFYKQTLQEGQEMLMGTDLFMYLPDVNNFVSMFFKKSIAKFAPKIFDAGRGGRVLKLGTSQREWKGRKWYDVTITPTDRAIEGAKLEIQGVALQKNVSIPPDKFNEYYKIFNDPDGSIETSPDGETRDR